jgi:hypothetical protein
MTHYIYSPNKNLKSPIRSAKFFKQTGSRISSKKNVTNKNNFIKSQNGNNFINILFASAGILSIISLALVFAPNLLATKVVKADVVKTPILAIVTNYNSQESKIQSKGKSFLQPVEVKQTDKK